MDLQAVVQLVAVVGLPTAVAIGGWVQNSRLEMRTARKDHVDELDRIIKIQSEEIEDLKRHMKECREELERHLTKLSSMSLPPT